MTIYGLSTTAIGHRPLSEALNIYETLKRQMNLSYLELAIGTVNPTEYDYPEPLILHDACLYHNGARIPFSIINEEHWHFYKTFTRRYKVLQVHLHAPRKNAIDESAIKTQVEKLMNFLELPVLIEIMPSPEYHYACPEISPDVPIVLDISHAHIWARGNKTNTQKYVQRLLPHAHCIHLSYNDGYKDTHDLIPQDSWIHTIAKPEATITYESLPAQFAKYQRRDFGRFHFLKPYHLPTNPASLL